MHITKLQGEKLGKLRAVTENKVKRASNKSGLPVQDSGALVDLVCDRIREAIRDGTLAPGHRLVEREVAEWLEVSRTPVREALRLLEAHGLASYSDGRSLVVMQLSESEIVELYFMWERLEGLAARMAAENASAAQIEMLQRLSEQWDHTASRQVLIRLNKRFHGAIHAAARNRYLTRAMRDIDDSVTLLGFATYRIPNRAHDVGIEHRAIVEAIAARKSDAAESAARSHIRTAGQLRLMLMAEDEKLQTSAREWRRPRY